MTDLRRLPMLAPRAESFETCVYCPKLCRAACPVSNAEHTETVTPWAKMSAAYFGARGDLPFDSELASLAWACTGCGACKAACDHENDVGRVLREVRAEALREGVAPAGAEQVVRRWDQEAAEHETRTRALEAKLATPSSGSSGLAHTHVVLFAGCGYVKHAPEVVLDAAFVVGRLLDAPVRLAKGCCGRPLLEAGATASFEAMADRLARELTLELRSGASRVVALEPGCMRTMTELAPRLSPRLSPRVPPMDLLVDLAHARLGRIPRGPAAQVKGLGEGGAALRWLDPCELGRHLGRFAEPRELLSHVTGRAPLEAQRSHEAAECSGGGGLLPLTRPATSAAIGKARVDEHRSRGGGTLVTGCSQAARRLRASGEETLDLVQVLARAMRHADGHERG